MKPIESQGVKFLFVPIFTYFLESFLFSPIFSRKPPIFSIFWKLVLAFEKKIIVAFLMLHLSGVTKVNVTTLHG